MRLAILLATALACAPALAEPLRAPFDVAALRTAKGGPMADAPCPPAPPPVRDVRGVPFYTDARHSQPDPDALAADGRAMLPLRDLLRGVQRSAERWVRSDPPGRLAAVCALAWLDAWAGAGAMLGESNPQGAYHVKWTLAGAALSWLQVRDAPGLDPAAVARVLEWFRRLASSVMPPYDRPGRTDALNNHAYWAGVAVGAAGIALDDRVMFDWAMRRAQIGLSQVAADGTLPLELARGRMARHYHLFALQALAVLDAMAHANGVELDDGALARLVAVTFRGAQDPAVFERLTGEKQGELSPRLAEQPLRAGHGLLVWLRRHPDPAMAAALRPALPLREPWLGGDTGLLFGP